jgi:hypothetical protein
LVLSVFFWIWISANGIQLVKFSIEQRRMVAVDRVDRNLTHVHELAVMIHDHVDDNSFVLVQKKLGRVETYLSHRSVLEPAQISRWYIANRPLYVLQPVDDEVSAMLSAMKLQPGPIVAQTGAGQRQWTLRQTIPAFASATERASTP